MKSPQPRKRGPSWFRRKAARDSVNAAAAVSKSYLEAHPTAVVYAEVQMCYCFWCKCMIKDWFACPPGPLAMQKKCMKPQCGYICNRRDRKLSSIHPKPGCSNQTEPHRTCV